MKHFVRVGDRYEIRCWREESDEIRQASLYGCAVDDGYEVSIKGTMTKELLEKILTDAPTDKSLYNKMTNFFTIHAENELCDIWSAHYGTEMYIDISSDGDIEFFEQLMKRYPESFSIGISGEQI